MIIHPSYIRQLVVCAQTGRLNYSIYKASMTLAKLIRKSNRNREIISKTTDVSDRARKVLHSEDTRKTTVLNKVFMDNISDIIGNGPYNEEMHRLGINIIKVKVLPSLRVMYVFWISDKHLNDNVVNEFFLKAGKHVALELSAMRLVSYLPKIQFVEDKEQFDFIKVNEILNNLTFENSELEQEEYKEENDKPKIPQLKIPPMQQNTFGLNHAFILCNILATRKKIEEYSESGNSSLSGILEGNLPTFNTKELSRKLFKDKYLLQKKRNQEWDMSDYEDNICRDYEECDIIEDYDAYAEHEEMDMIQDYSDENEQKK